MSDEKMFAQLKRHEGFRSKPYKDSVGVTTIGYGTNLDNGITEEEASMLMEFRLRALADELFATYAYEMMFHINMERSTVLINMLYNLGVPRLLGFKKMWAALSVGNFEKAADEMLDSKWAKQVGDRAIELSTQMRTGEWQQET